MDGDAPSRFKGDAENPVEQVSWGDVVTTFLPRVNALLPGLDLRLPTEAEWEYACRADAEPRSPFWFGQHIHSEQVNFDGNNPLPKGKESAHREHTVPVKALPCNGWGLYQMHGNVWEWCADWIAPYPALDLALHPAGPSEAPVKQVWRVLRGGSWISDARSCRSANRGADDPDIRTGDFGFRLARGAS